MEKRLDRLDDKMDRVEEVVIELKTDLRHYNERIVSHIAAEDKHNESLHPLLDKLPQIVEIAEAYQFDKKLKEIKAQKTKKFTVGIGIISTLIGIVLGLTRLF